MAVIKELIRSEADGSISFGNYELASKTKVSDFAHEGALYKVKTFREITRLERNEMFVYESVPGTAVRNFHAAPECVTFIVSGEEDAQVTLELDADTEYEIRIEGKVADCQKTNLGGKLSMSIALEDVDCVNVSVMKRR